MNAASRHGVAARFDALVLAAGRGPDDPMVKAFQISHKCLVPVAGTAMIERVLTALLASPSIDQIAVSIETPDILGSILDGIPVADRARIFTIKSRRSASTSAAHAVASGRLAFPLLITTADSALLSADIVEYFCLQSLSAGAQLTAGLASQATLTQAYPQTKRTYLSFSDGRFSGCNLYGLMAPEAVKAVEFWHRVENVRKKPWRLVGTFGLGPLLGYLTGTLSLASAFARASGVLGIKAIPVEMPFAEAAIDVDKPADLDLVEKILAEENPR